jgi:hypothetical protein
MPCTNAVRAWRIQSPEIDEVLARAREDGCDFIARQALDIADDSSQDYIEIQKGKSTVRVFDAEHATRSKLRVETRLKLLAVMDRARYGPGVELRNSKDAPLPAPTSVLQLTEAQLYEVAARGLPKPPQDAPK